MTTPQWNPGFLYQPGDIVVPRSTSIVTQQQPNNPSFEDVLNHWTQSSQFGSGTITAATDNVFDGTHSAYFAGANGTGPKNSVYTTLQNDYKAPVTPGQIINFSCMISRNPAPVSTSFCNGGARIYWYAANGTTLISISTAQHPAPYNSDTPAGMVGGLTSGGWVMSSGTAIAPAGAAFAVAAVTLTGNTSGAKIWADNFLWDYTHKGLPDGLVFRAVQAAAGFSAASEPAWPVTTGLTVVDNQVTWEAEFASRITWQATSILHSGTVEPTWPTEVGATVVDNTIAWVAYDGRVTDPKCPQSQVVAAGASKIFAGDTDIIAFCATTNPLDWSTVQDAGFLPFGLQSFGAEPVAGLNLYRSNLVAFNAQGYQMWQIDEDPANMALLDASPVGCSYPKSIQPVNNDLVYLTARGIRSIGIAGASTNLQAGSFGKQIDPLVLASIRGGAVPKALYYPGAGQYWLMFGSDAYVLTMNGSSSDMSWSRYTFPANIDYWTIQDGVLFLRAGNLVWEVSDQTFNDDDQGAGVHTTFTGYMSWPYLDMGPIGLEKGIEGFDLVCTGEVAISVGYSQSDFSLVTSSYTMSGDTLPGVGMVPFPVTAASFQFRLLWSPNQAWEWDALNVYVQSEGLP